MYIIKNLTAGLPNIIISIFLLHKAFKANIKDYSAGFYSNLNIIFVQNNLNKISVLLGLPNINNDINKILRCILIKM